MARVTLLKTTITTFLGTFSRTVTASYSPADGLEVAVHDLGPGATFDGDEYEAWYTVAAANIDAFCEQIGVEPGNVLRGLTDKYGGEDFDTLAGLMSENPLVRHSSYF